MGESQQASLELFGDDESGWSWQIAGPGFLIAPNTDHVFASESDAHVAAVRAWCGITTGGCTLEDLS